MITEDLIRERLPYLTGEMVRQFTVYCDMLLDWNTRMNLTAITEEKDVVEKHFADSLLPLELLMQGARVIDVGTGAGFPGIPLKIARPDLQLTLLDSLNKRIGFLQAVCSELAIRADCIHARAEDAARTKLRGSFDIALSRAVAGVPALTEYTVPFLKKGGRSLMYKGPQAEEELRAAHSALKKLNSTAELVSYPAPWGERNLIIVTKRGDTPGIYPRKAGTAAKDPL